MFLFVSKLENEKWYGWSSMPDRIKKKIKFPKTDNPIIIKFSFMRFFITQLYQALLQFSVSFNLKLIGVTQTISTDLQTDF